MTPALIAALSLQDKAEQYGAYAGIAAILGLGVLSLLYFAQAREVKRLREWAGRAPERAAELEARVTAQAEERRAEPAPAAAPVAPAAAGPATAGANGAGPVAPPAPPQPAAPVVGVPASERGAPARAPGVPASLPTAATAAVTAAGARAAPAMVTPGGPGAGSPTSFSGVRAPKPAAPSPPAPATAPAAPPAPARTNGDGVTTPPRPPAPATEPVRVPAPEPTPAPEPVPVSAGPAKPPRQIRTAAAPARAGSVQATVPPRTIPPRTAAALRERPSSSRAAGGRSRRPLVLAAGGMAAVVAIVVVLGITVAGDDGNQMAPRPNTVAPPSAPTPADGGTPTTGTATRVNRGDITVAVLNGTTVTGLARGASDKLTKAGFKPGVVTNDTTNQARSATAVLYSQGNRPAALDVARVVSVGRDAVQPIDQGTRLLAGEDADVVVSVGADQSQ